MTKQEKIAFVNDKADTFIQFGKLLQRTRSPGWARKVEDIAESRLSLEEKITQIEELDNEYSAYAAAHQHDEKKGITIKEAAQNRKNIKLFMKQNTFFNYLFFHWSKIRKYGREAHTITSGLLPFTLRLTESFGERFDNDIKSTYTRFLLPVIEHLLQTGWKQVTKKEYNLLVLFLKLLHKIKGLSLEGEDVTHQSFIHKMYGIEVYFLSFHYHKSFINILLSGLSRLMMASADYKAQIGMAIKYTKAILMPNEVMPSLYHFILSLNMVTSRQYCTFPELINKAHSGIVSRENFDCDNEISLQIKSYIDTIISDIKRLAEQKYEIQRIKENIPTKAGKEVDYSHFTRFYNSFNLSRDDYHFETDKDNMILFAERFLSKFITTFKHILNGKIKLKQDTPVALFARDFFDPEFNRLQLFHDKIANILIKLPFLTRTRYLKIKKGGDKGIAAEIEALQLIDHSLDIIWKLGKRLSNLIRKREPHPLENIAEITEIGFEDPIDLLAERKPSVIIPYSAWVIETDDLFYGKTVVDSLIYITSVCYVSSFFFYNETLHTLLKEEQSILKKINEEMALLQRVADRETYAQCRKAFEIL